MTQADKSEPDLGTMFAIMSDENKSAGERALRRLDAAMPPGMTFQQFDKETTRLTRQRKFAKVCRLWASVNLEELKEAARELVRVFDADELEWYVDDVRVPEQVERQVWDAPPRKRKSLMEGIVAAFRGLMKAHPRFDRVLETAAVRREEGQVFAEASRERRDELYRERVAWIASKYQEVRTKYPAGTSGDKAARLEVAYAYAKVTGKKPMHDRSVCNILDAAEKGAAHERAGIPG